MAKLQSGTVVYGNLTVNTFANIAGNLILGAQLYAGGSYGTNGQILQNVGGTGVAWANPSSGSTIFNGTSNVAVLSTGGNVVVSVGGAIIANVGSTGLTVIGGISAGTFTGNGAGLTGLPAGYSNVQVATYLPTYTGTVGASLINSTGNILSTGAIHNSLAVNGFSNIYITSGSTDSALQIVGNVSRGGAGYHDFLRVTSTFGTVLNPNMYFRLNTSGNLQIINSGYSGQLFEIQQSGNIVVAGALSAGGGFGSAGQYLQSTGSGIQWATVSGGATISDNTVTNAFYYVPFAISNTGAFSTAYINSSKLYFNPSSGTLYATVIQTLSDEKTKTNIKLIDNALAITKNLRGVTFDWKENGMSSAGLIAQDVAKYLPQLVNAVDEQTSLNYTGVIGLLVEAIKEQNLIIDNLSDRLAVLESK